MPQVSLRPQDSKRWERPHSKLTHLLFVITGRRVAKSDTRVGEGESSFTIGIAGEFRDRKIESDIQDAVAIRQRLDQWRQRQSGLGSILLIGTSSAAQSLQRRVEVACSIRTHIGLIEPSGGGADVLARHIHQLSASGEPLIQIDGPLMDAELLDSAVMPLLNRLSDSESALGSILCRQLDQTSPATQMRLFSLMESSEASSTIGDLGF